ncbi:cupin domain-containing protein [Candidatus Falkowbacteria bacterium CG10_big_fil_rev_8_21_14_0_10_39_11]|uniref:Cupin domain-containing protein n=1 Tax=Candidatus Falkowbacteria bacterium CG10_big_fil_rev_8_21_14_0_10_39_11 TaxID=1974565 RepID=A0A2H0V4J1_9BACT|nr:MAG: cupin domain-containing protein [Candidatus Falkowbacteria bacterium CG10_big_fil_rev_8_21_14_0_10_39_11]
MNGFADNIEKLTEENNKFRQVLYTSKMSQLVLMSLKPGEEIGAEVHDDHDQFFRFEVGAGKVMIDDNEYEVKADDAVVVPAGAKHNVINTSDSEVLKLYTIYSPPEHRFDVVHATREEAMADDEHFDGQLSE